MQINADAAGHVDDPLLGLPFDHHERYALTQRIVSYLWPTVGRDPLRVLEVGGHSSALKYFLPDDSIVLADIETPGTVTGLPFRFDAYFRASGTKLPFRDASFDLVIALDTLEHVPDEARPAFMNELVRVSSRCVILNGPTYHPATALAGQRLAPFLQRALSWESRFLQEHLELGLPRPEDIEHALSEQRVPFVTIANGNLTLWLAMNALKNYVHALPDGDQVSKALDRTYNRLLAPRDFGGLTYRTAYVIDKHDDPRALGRVRAAFAPFVDQSLVPADTAALEDHAVAFQRVVGDLKRDVEQMQAAISAKDARLAQVDTVLAQKDAHIGNIETALHQANVQAAATQHQLNQITGSAGYRLVELVGRPTRGLAPQGSRRHLGVKAAARALNILVSEGPWTLVRRALPVWRWLPRLHRGFAVQQGATLDDQYQLWLKAHELTPARTHRIRRAAASLAYRPRVSIVMPVYNPDPAWLRAL